MTATARTAPVLEFRQTSLTYPGPPPVTALQPCDLRVNQGEFVTVVGPSGSGKSTFLNIVGLLDTPTGGTYTLTGQNTAALPERARAKLRAESIGFVFQAFHLLPHRTALENVCLSLLYGGVPRKQREALAIRSLHTVGLGHRIAARSSQLSGGERQRVAIARALVKSPSLLLCDEPTGNLDTVSAANILRLIGELNEQGMTVLLITHDPAVAAKGTRTLQIRDGVLSESAALQSGVRR